MNELITWIKKERDTAQKRSALLAVISATCSAFAFATLGSNATLVFGALAMALLAMATISFATSIKLHMAMDDEIAKRIKHERIIAEQRKTAILN